MEFICYILFDARVPYGDVHNPMYDFTLLLWALCRKQLGELL